MPRGVYVRKSALIAVETLQDAPGSTRIAPMDLEAFDMVFGIRSLKAGPFKGLWEVVELNRDGSIRKQIAAATSRGYAINQAVKAMSKLAIRI